MGFRPSLKTVDQGVTPEASFLASEHSMAKRVGVTLDASTVVADGDGNKIVKAGTAVAYVAATGKYRLFGDGLAADAGGPGGSKPAGLTWETINLRDGDLVAGILIHGSALLARCTGASAAFRTDVAGRITFQ